MSIPTGTRLGTYEVLSLLGAGGMGEVYLAHDSKLERQVAIKVLPALFAQDPARLARFKREAQLLAALNHSNIASIYGQEEHNGIPFLVLELVQGETLAERLTTGAMDLEEALGLCRQIAEALEAAHEKGVLHRDLKPANVKVTPEGKVKVLDFGLAKAFDMEGSDASLMHSPTISVAATRHGVVLGTAAYMSPEQARGRVLDKRTDIWSFGCVLFEMLSGTQVFGGATTSDMTAAVLRQEPDWNALPAATPTRIKDLLRRCLQKDASRRLRDIGDVRLEIEETLNEPAAAPPERTERGTFTRAVPWVLAAALAAVLVAVYAGKLSMGFPAAPRAVVRFTITLPEKESIAPKARPAVALSPDGKTVVYVAGPRGSTRIYRRDWDKLEATPVEGTEGGSGPFFSPDGQWLAFITTERSGGAGSGNFLKKVPLGGGAPIVIAPVPPVACGGVWGPDGNILLTPTQGQGLVRIPAAGGKHEPVSTPNSKIGEQAHLWPDLLPGGKTVLVAITTAGSEISDVVALSLQTGARQTLVKGGGSPRYLAPGYLVYARSGSLFAQSFDPVRLTVSGSPMMIVQGVSSDPGSGASHFAVSGNGSLAYVPGEALTYDRELVSVDRQGKARPLVEARRYFAYPRVSPDGQMVALNIGGYNSHVWIYSIARGNLSRLTFDGPVEWSPIWSPDGKRIAYTSMKSGKLPGLFLRPADGSGSEELLLSEDSAAQFVAAMSPDAKVMVFNEVGINTMKSDIRTLELAGPRRPVPFLKTPSKEWGADFSPDGRWLTYVSDESGRPEIYVMPFPGPGAKQQISTEGGTEPAWARKGGELFYRNGDKMMAVPVRTEPSFSASAPYLLFTGLYAEHSAEDALREYDVTPDGRSFVMIREVAPKSTATQLNVVLGWVDELRKASTAARR